MHVYMYICMQAYMHEYMYVCMHVVGYADMHEYLCTITKFLCCNEMPFPEFHCFRILEFLKISICRIPHYQLQEFPEINNPRISGNSDFLEIDISEIPRRFRISGNTEFQKFQISGILLFLKFCNF